MMPFMKKAIALLVIAILLVSVGRFLYFENNSIVVANLKQNFDNLPANFENFRILQISDLHGKTFGKKQAGLLGKIRAYKPDIIVITGDLINRYSYDDRSCLDLVRQSSKIAPVYFVTGNHEWQSGKFAELEPKLGRAGAKVLSDTSVKIKRGNEEIFLVGIDDITRKGSASNARETAGESLLRATRGIDNKEFKILLAHRPELMTVYAKSRIDLVFSGHAHGGQIRVPFVGALFAPDQDFLPSYTSGRYRVGKTILVVSRGLGNGLIPQRLFNRPQLIVMTLKRSDN